MRWEEAAGVGRTEVAAPIPAACPGLWVPLLLEGWKFPPGLLCLWSPCSLAAASSLHPILRVQAASVKSVLGTQPESEGRWY